MIIKQEFIPKGRKNRPGYKLVPEYITVHDTANTDAGADAKAHVGYLRGDRAASIPSSWHFTVDDKDTIYQHLPLTENGWHAGDGTNGTGNRQSIAVEICENSDGNRAKAEANAAWLVAKLLKDYGLKIGAVKQHYNWSGKNCPRVLRGRAGGWQGFLAAVEKHLKPATATAPSTSASTSASGTLYRVQVGAYAVKANAEAALKKAKAAGFTDAFITGGPAPTSTSTPKPATPKPVTPALKVGSRVKVKRGAKDYDGRSLASFVYDRTYVVIQVNGDRVVIGQGAVVTAAVHKIDLVLA